MRNRICTFAVAVLMAGCGPLLAAEPEAGSAGVANPAVWPAYEYPVRLSSADEARIADLVRRMTRGGEGRAAWSRPTCAASRPRMCARPTTSARSWSAGTADPGGNDLGAGAQAGSRWRTNSTRRRSTTSDGGVGIPLVWGTDAVHGHSNIIGATLFPHNIGLGAMRDARR